MSTTETEYNPFEHRARTKKAIKLAACLVQAGLEPEQEITSVHKELAVAVTGVHPGSEATWAVVEALVNDTMFRNGAVS